MAINDFTGQNIQDTYQRVVQTDGTNRLADGTGSIFIPVSSSHAITASHALFAVSASHEITFEVSSSHAINADTASFATNFTASGDISASGNLLANGYKVDGYNGLTFDSTTLQVGNANYWDKIRYGRESSDQHLFAGNVTASGTISSSKTISGLQYVVNGASCLGALTNVLGVTTVFIGNTTDNTEIDGTNIKLDAPVTASGNISASGTSHTFGGNIAIDNELQHIGDADTKIGFSDDVVSIKAGNNESNFRSTGLQQEGHITASGNISASGNIIGDALKITPTDTSEDVNHYVTFQKTGNNLTNITNGFSFNPSIDRLKLGGRITLQGNAGHITASGNITSSGNIDANQYKSNGQTFAQFVSDMVQIGGGVQKPTTFSGTTIKLGTTATQHVTASGNISTSGNIIADDANFDGTIQVGLGGTNTDGIKIGPGGSESFLTNINGLRLQPNTQDPTQATTPHVTVGAGAHITASGNISASGTSHILGGDLTIGDDFTFGIHKLTTHASGLFNLISGSTSILSAQGNHVTASGNISASGIITALKLHARDTDSSAGIALFDADGNGIANLARVGSGDNAHRGRMVLRDNANIKVQITTNGDSYLNGINPQLGIGTDSPSNTLHVVGDAKINSHITASGNISASATSFIQTPVIKGTGTGTAQLDVQGQITASGNISSSNDIIANRFVGTIATAAQPNITSLGTLTTLTAGTLRLTSTTDASATSTGHAFQSGLTSGANIIINSNEVMARNNGAVAALYLNPDGGVVAFQNSEANSVQIDHGQITASSNISSSGTIIAKEIDVRGHITASGAISSSGTIKASGLVAEGVFASRIDHIDDAKTGVQFPDGIFVTSNSHITASGDISASGTIITNEITASSIHLLGDNKSITFDNGTKIIGDHSIDGFQIRTQDANPIVFKTNGNNIRATIAADGEATFAGVLNSTKVNTGQGDTEVHLMDQNIRTSDNVEFVNITATGNTVLGNASTDTHTITGHITASNNIKASGNIVTDKIVAHTPFSSDSLLNLHDDNVVNANGVTLSSIGSMVFMLDSNDTGTVDKFEFRADSQDAGAGNLLATIEDNGDFTVEGNITASKNISASGTIITNEISCSTAIESTLYTIDGQNAIDFSSNTHLFGNVAKFSKLRTQKGLEVTAPITASSHISASGTVIANEIDVKGHITASGDISASGLISAANFHVPGQGRISFDNTDTDDQFIKGLDNLITIDGDDTIRLKADDHVEFADNSNNAKVSVDGNNGHITASGTISASGGFVGTPVIIHEWAGYLASFVDGNYYYGSTLYGPTHHVWNGKVTSEPTNMNDLGSARHGLYFHHVPFNITNIGIQGGGQSGNTGTDTIQFHLYKTTPQNNTAASNSTLTKIGVAETDNISNTNRHYTANLTSTVSCDAGDALVLLVRPTGTSAAIRWNYTIFGYSNG